MPTNLETGALTGDGGQPGEFDLIASVFAPLTDGDERALGLPDDAAVLPQAAGRIPLSPPIPWWKASISWMPSRPTSLPVDCRGKPVGPGIDGAEPTAYVLNLTLPARTNKEWLSSFAEGVSGRSISIRSSFARWGYNPYQDISHRDGDVAGRGADAWRDHQEWSAPATISTSPEQLEMRR